MLKMGIIYVAIAMPVEEAINAWKSNAIRLHIVHLMVYNIFYLGNCVDTTGSLVCNCNPGWGGLRCKQPSCGNKGCVPPSYKYNKLRNL